MGRRVTGAGGEMLRMVRNSNRRSAVVVGEGAELASVIRGPREAQRCVIEQVGDGGEALELIRREPPELVIR
jgi:CheY-like chemotaxis protein